MQCPKLNLTTSVTPRAGRSLGRADMQPAGSKGIPVGEGVGGVGGMGGGRSGGAAAWAGCLALPLAGGASAPGLGFTELEGLLIEFLLFASLQTRGILGK